MSQAKEQWEKLASELKEDEVTKKAFETLDNIDKSLKGTGLNEEDRGFRLPYSSRPKVTNGRWK